MLFTHKKTPVLASAQSHVPTYTTNDDSLIHREKNPEGEKIGSFLSPLKKVDKLGLSFWVTYPNKNQYTLFPTQYDTTLDFS